MRLSDPPTAPDMTWAVTMFSFTNELHERERTADELLRGVASAAVADAVEVDAAQHFASFPAFARTEIDAFRRSIDASGLTPTMMGAYLDRRIDARGPRSMDDDLEMLSRQAHAASVMGFFGIRISLGSVHAGLREQLLPDLERWGVRLLFEVQAGARPDSPAIDEIRRQRDKLDTDRIGFVFDTSLIMSAVPPTWREALLADGVPDALLIEVEDLWQSHASDGWRRTQDAIAGMSLPPAAIRRLEMPFRRFGCADIVDWDDFFDDVMSVHLKYWDLDERGRTADETRVVKDALRRHGYRGFVCSEWGGHDWLDSDTHPALEMTRRHRALFDRV
ncbi:hypothetical protein [Microbacterium hydrothermale]|uniref:hypothetical protein n=1 Tax=Microbacterium hydrothermale TaxID=857427 RepID=UPI0010A90FD7|nr:hypothetical protein [Microbacterium hydrothermale]